MESIINFVGNVSTLFTIILFLSGYDIIKKIRKSGTIGQYSLFPFVSTIYCCAFWFWYGLEMNLIHVIVVNGIGAIIETIYLINYLSFLREDETIAKNTSLFPWIGAFVSSYLICHFQLIDSHLLSYNIGIVGSIGSLLVFGSPLAQLREVVATQSNRTLSFPLCFMNLITSSSWSLYGYLLDDTFIMLPNSLGIVLAIIQLFLIYHFPNVSPINQAIKLINNH
ncbi:hypothetical protein SNEBB_000526 [Seison nebaliae]|nr:hypothetical protein SNEBB_000526 [Seison nebaliae]